MGKSKNKATLQIFGLLISLLILSIPSGFIMMVSASLFGFHRSELYFLYDNYPQYLLLFFIICSTPILFIKLWHSKTRLSLVLQIFVRALFAVIYVLFIYLILHVVFMIDIIIPALIKMIAH